jgi:hypothetical protein
MWLLQHLGALGRSAMKMRSQSEQNGPPITAATI